MRFGICLEEVECQAQTVFVLDHTARLNEIHCNESMLKWLLAVVILITKCNMHRPNVMQPMILLPHVLYVMSTSHMLVVYSLCVLFDILCSPRGGWG